MTKSRFLFFVAVHAFFIKDDKVLILKRQNTGYRDNFYGVPAGHVDGGETIAAAISREILEEVGVTVPPETLKPVHVTHRIVSETEERIDYFFMIRDWSGEIKNTEPEKCAELRWVATDELPENMILYVASALKQSLEQVQFSEHVGD